MGVDEVRCSLGRWFEEWWNEIYSVTVCLSYEMSPAKVRDLLNFASIVVMSVR